MIRSVGNCLPINACCLLLRGCHVICHGGVTVSLPPRKRPVSVSVSIPRSRLVSVCEVFPEAEQKGGVKLGRGRRVKLAMQHSWLGPREIGTSMNPSLPFDAEVTGTGIRFGQTPSNQQSYDAGPGLRGACPETVCREDYGRVYRFTTRCFERTERSKALWVSQAQSRYIVRSECTFLDTRVSEWPPGLL